MYVGSFEVGERYVGDDADEDHVSLGMGFAADSVLDVGLTKDGVLSGETFTRICVDFTIVPVELRVRADGPNGRGEN